MPRVGIVITSVTVNRRRIQLKDSPIAKGVEVKSC
jgi:hypothetical protein